jgi:hypothetical protein
MKKYLLMVLMFTGIQAIHAQDRDDDDDGLNRAVGAFSTNVNVKTSLDLLEAQCLNKALIDGDPNDKWVPRKKDPVGFVSQVRAVQDLDEQGRTVVDRNIRFYIVSQRVVCVRVIWDEHRRFRGYRRNSHSVTARVKNLLHQPVHGQDWEETRDVEVIQNLDVPPEQLQIDRVDWGRVRGPVRRP